MKPSDPGGVTRYEHPSEVPWVFSWMSLEEKTAIAVGAIEVIHAMNAARARLLRALATRTRYRWKTVPDDRVRPHHAPNCRCFAEPPEDDPAAF